MFDPAIFAFDSAVIAFSTDLAERTGFAEHCVPRYASMRLTVCLFRSECAGRQAIDCLEAALEGGDIDIADRFGYSTNGEVGIQQQSFCDVNPNLPVPGAVGRACPLLENFRAVRGFESKNIGCFSQR